MSYELSKNYGAIVTSVKSLHKIPLLLCVLFHDDQVGLTDWITCRKVIDLVSNQFQPVQSNKKLKTGKLFVLIIILNH